MAHSFDNIQGYFFYQKRDTVRILLDNHKMILSLCYTALSQKKLGLLTTFGSKHFKQGIPKL